MNLFKINCFIHFSTYGFHFHIHKFYDYDVNFFVQEYLNKKNYTMLKIFLPQFLKQEKILYDENKVRHFGLILSLKAIFEILKK